jgi:Zn-dependent M32 family carboxypeptidase
MRNSIMIRSQCESPKHRTPKSQKAKPIIVGRSKLFMETCYQQIRNEFGRLVDCISLDDIMYSFRMFEGNILKH